MESHLEQAVLRVMALAASGTGEIATPGGTLAIVVFGDGEGRAAAAGDQEHAEGKLVVCLRGASGCGRSLATAEKRLLSGQRP